MNAARSLAPLFGTLVALAGCVTETVSPSRGMRVVPGASQQLPARVPPGSPRPVTGATLTLPSGPVATPALTVQNTLSRVEIGVIPLGSITYDGQTLPLTSPDGRFVVVQEGEAPTWEVMLAEPGAHPPMRTALAVYEVGDRVLTRIQPSQPLPPGLILGRATDDDGFLVEAPQADGSRWIGHVEWLGNLNWLVQGAAVNAHATLTPRGDLVYTRRPLESDESELVVRSRNGQESTRPADGGDYGFPMCTSDISLVYALHLSEAGIELQAIRLDRAGMDSPARLGATVARRKIQPKADRLEAYQIAATSQPALPSRTGLGTGDPALTIGHPRLGRMAAYRLESSEFEPLAPSSIAAVPSHDPARPGFYCTTTEALVFVPPRPAKAGAEPPVVRVLPSAYVPRRISGTPESMILFGPAKGRPDQLEVVKLVVGPPTEPTPQN